MPTVDKLLEKLKSRMARIRDLNGRRSKWPRALANLWRSQESINRHLLECLDLQSEAIGLLAAERDARPAKKRSEATPTHEGDGLVTYGKNVAWMNEPAFRAAYQAGVNSGHKLGGKEGSAESLRLEWRTHMVLWAAKHASLLEGDFVECGVNTGIFSLAICHYLDFARLPKRFWLFDTYCGIPALQASPEEKARVDAMNEAHYEDCYDTAKRNFAPWPNALLVKGIVPESLRAFEGEKVAYLSIDMNVAEPELAALEFFWPKLVTGAVVVFDDYGFAGYEAQRLVHDRFAARNGLMIATLPTGQGLLIKP